MQLACTHNMGNVSMPCCGPSHTLHSSQGRPATLAAPLESDIRTCASCQTKCLHAPRRPTQTESSASMCGAACVCVCVPMTHFAMTASVSIAQRCGPLSGPVSGPEPNNCSRAICAWSALFRLACNCRHQHNHAINATPGHVPVTP